MPLRRRMLLTARTADKLDLYERSVQSPDVDVPFMMRLHRRLTGRPLRRLREDFCGTALICCEFVKQHRENRALGIDLDGHTLRWGMDRNVARLERDQRRRLTLLRRNVLDVRGPLSDLTCAMNFSYSIFKTREDLRRYLVTARRGLRAGGVMLLDSYGGPAAQRELQERKRKGGFMYIWEQASFDPISHHTLCRIHFAFRDGSRLRNAFVYDWRLWTLPEVQEIMVEAGFHDVHVLWEETDRETNEGNSVFRRARKGKADDAWISYVVGRA